MSSGSTDSTTQTSSDGIDYEVLSPGSTVEYEYVDYAKQSGVGSIGGYPVHNFYVKCQEVKDNLLPIEANPREPTNSSVVGAMQDTLENENDRFVRRNNGITIVCKNISRVGGSSKVKLEFSNDGEGICNGGHTYFAINTFRGNLDNAGVHIEAIEVPEDVETGDREGEIADIAEARNNINNLEDYTILDYLDCFDPLRNYMEDENVVSWHEGDADAIPPRIDTKALIRYISVADPLKYSHQILNPDQPTHRNSALGYGDFSDWRNEVLNWNSGSGTILRNIWALLSMIFLRLRICLPIR